MKPKKIKFTKTVSTPEGFLRENMILEAPFSKIVEAEIEFGVGTIEVLEYEEKKQEEPKEEPSIPAVEKKKKTVKKGRPKVKK